MFWLYIAGNFEENWKQAFGWAIFLLFFISVHCYISSFCCYVFIMQLFPKHSISVFCKLLDWRTFQLTDFFVVYHTPHPISLSNECSSSHNCSLRLNKYHLNHVVADLHKRINFFSVFNLHGTLCSPSRKKLRLNWQFI